MNIIIALLLIVGGVASIVFIRKKALSTATEMKYMQTKSIAELK